MKWRWAVAVAAVVAALGAWPAFLAVRRWMRGPNVVVVVADTLRADRVGVYGNDRGLTPFLDSLAARGTVFRHAYSACSWTSPSVASLFTSRYPTQHHVVAFDAALADDEVTLAERLAERHYLTGGFSANLRLTRPLGYGQGFIGWFPFASHRKVTAARLARKTLTWIDTAWNRRARRPLFLYFQTMETHGPYDPDHEPRGGGSAESALRRRFGLDPTADHVTEVNQRLIDLRFDDLSDADVALLEGRYDAEVALLDTRLRAFFAALERRGVLDDDTIIVFTADHGEEFRDHGRFLHGTSLFEDQIRVPLIVVGGGLPAGRVVDRDVSLVDVAPTLLAMLGLPPEPRFEGRSLLPLDGVAAHDVIAEQPPTGRRADLGLHRMALVRERLKLVVPRDAGPSHLYDLATDPRELRPDPPAHAADAVALDDAAATAAKALASRPGIAAQGTIDERMRARLRALGYTN